MRAKQQATRAKRPIPPRSTLELFHADRTTPGWRGKIGRRFRVGYYRKSDGLDVIWLVDETGDYVETVDPDSIGKYLRVVKRSNETSMYGRDRPVLRALPGYGAKAKKRRPVLARWIKATAR